ncbi:unnamed protein product, partial [Didymodactylos carnosus]
MTGIYWPQGQTRNLDDLKSFITKNTIITGDFNATVLEWGSPETDQFLPKPFGTSDTEFKLILEQIENCKETVGNTWVLE